ncbi:MAG: hypothetical protein M2R45_01946 [Verrucomicrobia subdivision 3 bacterium]|nr:hypothetical protein [Limisphaerales bacterium]MCS1416188.1 hypothetical protein [Limisphaerales bacterium]
MRLCKLNIHSLPGIDRGFTFFAPPSGTGVNIVTGPNAIGKSSLVRALKYLLVREVSDPLALNLEATFQGSAAHWRVTRHGSHIVWQRDGVNTSPPVLPGSAQFSSYRLSVESLLQDDDKDDKALAEQLRRELHGNFDLDAARGAEITSRFAQHEATQLRRAAKDRREIENNHARLQDREEKELPDLEERIEGAKEAANRQKYLQLGKELIAAVAACKASKAALEAFPPAMDQLQGGELKQLEEFQQKREQRSKELRGEEHGLKLAQAELRKTGLADAAPQPAQIETIRQWFGELDKKSVGQEHAAEACADAEAHVQTVVARFGGGDTPPTLDTDAFKRAEKIAVPLMEANKRHSELTVQLEMAGQAPEEAEVEQCQKGVAALLEWLAGNAAGAGTGGADKLQRSAHWVALAAAALAAAMAFFQGALFVLPLFLIAFLVSASALFLRRSRSTVGTPMDSAKRDFEKTGLDAPTEWSGQAVRECLNALESRLNALLLQREKAANASRIEYDIAETKSEIEKLEASKTALAQEIGFDPSLPVAEFQRFIDLCREWDDARTTHAQKTRRLKLLDQKIDDISRKIRDALAPWQSTAAQQPDDSAGALDTARLRSDFESLQKRVGLADKANETIRSCNQAIRSREEQINDVEQNIAELYAKARLELGDSAALNQRIEQLPAWKKARDTLQEAQIEERRLRGKLKAEPKIIRLVDEGRQEQLEEDFREASSKAEGHVGLVEERSALKTELDRAGKDRELEKAAAKEGQARQALEDKHDEALLSVVTETLLTDVEQAYKAKHQPEVLRRARAIFAEVTAQEFDLVLRSEGAFAAKDRRQDQRKELVELSSGTRMQLLLALRLAWIESLEGDGEALPLFLDEALTTSDEGRFTVMAKSLERIAAANEGRRQIFYLSARRHESALWRQTTGVEPQVIDLEAVRFPPGELSPADYVVELPPSLPPPDGRSPEEYASQLSVRPIDPYLDAGSIHLFYVLQDDLQLLHRLMDPWRITSLGQLEGLLDGDAAQHAIGGKDDCLRLRQRCQTARAWLILWRQGRGQPVDRSVLEASEAISDVFIDRVAKLAESLGGDGKQLVSALRRGEVHRFQTKATDKLEQWLADKGYTDDQPTLSTEDRSPLILQRVVRGADADVDDVRKVAQWLESAVAAGKNS